MKAIIRTVTVAACLGLSAAIHAAVLTFEASDFATSPAFSHVQTFGFSIDIAAPLVAGATYANPVLNSVIYNVYGTLDNTPSGFNAFFLQRSIVGGDFYAQGSSLSFTISGLADLSDGLQLSELTAAAGPVFTFDGREFGTGRYHTALVQLYADGLGRIQNSNNMGGINQGSGNVVNVDYGDEYITDLSFDPAALTLANPSLVPVPAAAWLFGSALIALGAVKRRYGGC